MPPEGWYAAKALAADPCFVEETYKAQAVPHSRFLKPSSKTNRIFYLLLSTTPCKPHNSRVECVQSTFIHHLHIDPFELAWEARDCAVPC